MVLDTVPELSDTRPRLSDDLGHDTDVDSGSPTDVTVGNEFADPGFYLPVRLWMRLRRKRNTRTSFTVAASAYCSSFNMF